MRSVNQLAIIGILIVSNVCLYAQVELRETATEFSLSSQKIGLTIEKNSAKIIGLRFRGQEVLAPSQSGYFTLIAGSVSSAGVTLPVRSCH